MPIRRTATMTVFNRPEYLRQALESLKETHPRDTTLIIGLEPVSDVCREICARIDFMETKILYNSDVLGLEANLYNVLRYAFENGSELNLLLEDDDVISPDALELADWYSRQNLDGIMHLQLVQILRAPRDQAAIVLHGGYLPWGSVFTREQWETYIRPTWNMYDPAYSWDWRIHLHQQQLGAKAMMPLLSRARTVGVRGTNFSENPWSLAFAALPISDARGPFDYAVLPSIDVYVRVVARAEHAGEVRAIVMRYCRACRGHTDLQRSVLLQRAKRPDDLMLIQRWSFLDSFYRTLQRLKDGDPALKSLECLLAEPYELALAMAPVDLHEYEEVIVPEPKRSGRVQPLKRLDGA